MKKYSRRQNRKKKKPQVAQIWSKLSKCAIFGAKTSQSENLTQRKTLCWFSAPELLLTLRSHRVIPVDAHPAVVWGDMCAGPERVIYNCGVCVCVWGGGGCFKRLIQR